jgi:transcriptional regulator with XRE-family HTH domain
LIAAATGNERIAPEGVPANAIRVFGETLRKLCASARVESEEVAARAHLGLHRFQEIDSGLSEPDIVEEFNIARALDMAPSELLKHFEDALSASAF